MKWQLRIGQALRLLRGDDESVIYNDHSGETHVLSYPAIQLLLRLQRGPADIPALRAILAQDWEFDSEAELNSVACQLIDELNSLSLIELSPS